MATVVEIANTTLTTYSPLNEKHNILYNRLRHIINERHVQRPWFDLDSLIASGGDKDVDLDKFKPDNSLDYQQLESLTLVEDYFGEKPVMTREFSISGFWDYVYSTDWAEGFSIRVLEGRLQNMLLATITTLIQADVVTQHSTMAYAKSRRRRHTFYKLSAKVMETSHSPETLLLEFIYYGHRRYMDTETSSLCYPGNTTTTMSSLSEELESSDMDKDPQDAPRDPPRDAIQPSLCPRPPAGVAGLQQARHKRLQQRNARLTQLRGRCPSATQKASNKQLSRIQEEETSARGRRGLRETQSNTFSESEWEYVPPRIDLNKFMCTEKVSYLGEFELPDDSSSDSDSDIDDNNYGQEFYLGDTRSQACDKKEPLEVRLRKRKEEVVKEREARRRKLAEYKPKKSILPVMSVLDVNKYVTNTERENTMTAAKDAVPDFMTFIQLLKEDKVGQVESNVKFKYRWTKRVKKSKVLRPEHKKFGDYVGGVTDSVPCKLHCYNQRDSSWRSMKPSVKKNYMVQQMLISGRKVQAKLQKKKKETKKTRDFQIPYIYITTSTGITYMHPISKLMMRSKAMERQKDQTQTAATPNPGPSRRRVCLPPTSSTTLSQEIIKNRQLSASSLSSAGSASPRGSPLRNFAMKFPKTNINVVGDESPDLESEDEDDSLEISSFDTNKLNIRYSIERIRLTRKKRTPATFHGVLKKYCRMQSIIKAFTPPTPGSRRRSSIVGHQGHRPQFRRRRKTMVKPVVAVNPMTVGKLRWFRFLDAHKKVLPAAAGTEDEDSGPPLFENYSMELFREKVVRALEDFVVRREVVISDASAKTSVSVTFTRKEVFTRSKGLTV